MDPKYLCWVMKAAQNDYFSKYTGHTLNTRIDKFIQLAFNNSSASEAAQSLKMLAAVLHVEGINPATLLQPKTSGAELAEVASLRRELAETKADYNSMVDRYNQAVRALKTRIGKIEEQSSELQTLESELVVLRKLVKDYQEHELMRAGKNDPIFNTQQASTLTTPSGLNYSDKFKQARNNNASLADHYRARNIKRMFDELNAMSSQVKGSFYYHEPKEGEYIYGEIVYLYELHDTYGMWITHNDGDDGIKVWFQTKGPRGAMKDSGWKHFKDEESFADWFLKHWTVLN